MSKMKFERLDEIIGKTIESIKSSVEEIKDISSYAKKEYLEIEEEFLKLKIEATDLIERVDDLEKNYKISKSKLLMVNKNFDAYSESEMKSIYEETDQLRITLAVEKEREVNIIRRRNELELHLKYVHKISQKADKLSQDFNVAYGVLTGDLKLLTEKIDDIQTKEIWGLKVIHAQEQERQRIARDIHDGPAQNMSNLIIKTEYCIRLLDKDINLAKNEMQVLKDQIRLTINEMRGMIYNLRPMSIDDLGLIPTLERLVEKMSEEIGCKVELVTKSNNKTILKDLDEELNLTLYRIAQEALNNIKKYASASVIRVEIVFEDDAVRLSIIDNGVGFNVGDVKLNLKDNKGFGLSMMRERANLLGTSISIVSEIGKGTIIDILVPTKKEEILSE
jgi:two-component system, NarL family, sensor histidine kinase DegS